MVRLRAGYMYWADGQPFQQRSAMTMIKWQDDADTLEQILDRRGLQDFFLTLVHVLEEKEQHIRHTWQDEYLAKCWANVADCAVSPKLSKAIGKLPYSDQLYPPTRQPVTY